MADQLLGQVQQGRPSPRYPSQVWRAIEGQPAIENVSLNRGVRYSPPRAHY
jgi:hypothetical protein